jgi:hypothetical protein
LRLKVYVRKGKAIIPTIAQTEAGYWLDVKPVEVADVADRPALIAALQHTVARGNPTVPVPTRAAFPEPVVLPYAGVKTWSAFTKGASGWKLSKDAGSYVIAPYRDGQEGGWEEDLQRKEEIPAEAPIDSVLQRLVDHIISG